MVRLFSDTLIGSPSLWHCLHDDLLALREVRDTAATCGRGAAWPRPQAGAPGPHRRPVQPLMKASRSALTTSACVVHMPCGNFS